MYVNLNNPANFQLQEFEQLGFRYIVTGRPTISGETYRTIFVLADAVVTATCPNGDSLSSETLVAGTIIHGFFESVSVASGSLLAYKAGPITAQEIYDFYKAYVYANGGIIEGESCAVTEIAALLAEGLYSMASLVLIPSGYKVGTVYSERPTDSNGQLTFTRNSEATRVNSEGLVEKVRTNILTYSNTFSNGAWTKLLVTVTGGQEGYDGTNNAWLLQITDPIGRLEGFPFLNNLVTLSIYAKAGTTNVLTLAQLNAYSYVTCDLSNGTFTGQGGSVVYRNIESVGNGWYRIQLASTGGTLTGISIAPVGIVGDNVYIQNVQLEYGNIATDYIPTTTASVSVGPVANLPRLDYSGGATCPSLLLEPQRTNDAAYSEYFNIWTQPNASVTANDIISPEGVQNGYKLTSTSNSTASRVEIFPSLTDNTIYTGSAFVKKGNVNFAFLTIRPKNSVTESAFFDLENGTVTGQGSSPDEATIEPYGNDWYKISLSTNAETGGTTPRFQIAVANTDGSVVTNVDEYIYIYGAQLEAGSYPTSYIPTYGTTVTRLADDFSKTGISSLIGQTEGTLFVDFVAGNDPIATIGQWLLFLGNGSTYIAIFVSSTQKLRVNVANGVTQALIDTSYNVAAGTRYKAALAYKENDFAFYVNGVLVGTDTSGTVPATSSIQANYNTTAANMVNAKYNQALVFKTRLTNAQLAALTTL